MIIEVRKGNAEYVVKAGLLFRGSIGYNDDGLAAVYIDEEYVRSSSISVLSARTTLQGYDEEKVAELLESDEAVTHNPMIIKFFRSGFLKALYDTLDKSLLNMIEFTVDVPNPFRDDDVVDCVLRKYTEYEDGSYIPKSTWTVEI